MQLRQPTFTYSVCGIFPRNKKRIQFSFSKKREIRGIFRKGMDYGSFKDQKNSF